MPWYHNVFGGYASTAAGEVLFDLIEFQTMLDFAHCCNNYYYMHLHDHCPVIVLNCRNCTLDHILQLGVVFAFFNFQLSGLQ